MIQAADREHAESLLSPYFGRLDSNALMSDHATEISRGQRYAFGKNWRRFLRTLNDERIAEAERNLREMLGIDDLKGNSFLDIGSGSGLSSLAARRLGARVHSFDYDPESVACTRELKHRYFSDDTSWTIEEGSALDRDYLKSLGKFDVVYSWGVLHHTGAMWQALDNAAIPIGEGGRLFIAIYNNQRSWTPVHTLLKRAYVRSPWPFNWLIAGPLIAFYTARGFLKDVLQLKDPTARYRNYNRLRGMSWWHDCLDWIGGYPFETAKPDDIFNFYQRRGFTLERMITCGGGPGCNQFVFRRASG
jgi:2-polyprenyl-3-methyl-5-hydroxy-6-metoxy-1,4-benzoquinol methylase